MKYIRSLTQQRLCLMLAVYIGLFLNGAVLFRRVEGYFEHLTVRNGIFAAIEVFGSILATFFLLRLLSLFGRRTWQVLASLVVIISAAASYYMTFMNVVIGYGIVASVMTTDIDLSKEVVGQGFIMWTILTCLIPLFFIWSNTCRYTLLRQLRTRGQRIRNVAVVLLAGLLVWAPIRLMEKQQKRIEKATGVDMPSYGGVVANSYLPSNWLSALGLYAWAQADESSDVKSLINPTKKFTYQAPADGLDDTYVVFVIGETTRWDHMGILGYDRDTTPKLAQEKNLVAYRGYSCDTATKLSLRCMFVREGGASDNPQRTLKEQNVFAVLKQLGFSSDLFAMQSEMWFYTNTMADNIAYREQIGAEPRNRGKNVDDMLLLSEMEQSLKNHPQGKHLIVLHTKGSHYSYYQRYTRDFAKWTPECVGINKNCSKQELINAYDNSILYVDTFLSRVIDQLRDKKAIVIYAADHGESINEKEHLHGTPRKLAPPEQFRVPMIMWMSDKYLENPDKAKMFAHLKQQAEIKVPRRGRFAGLALAEEELVARVAWCYYHDGLTQNDIGERLGLPRLKISRLLEKGRQSGVIRVQINSRYEGCLALETELQQRFGLKLVRVMPALNTPPMNVRLGIGAAQSLMGVLQPGQLLAVGFGETTMSSLQHLSGFISSQQIRLVTLSGGVGPYMTGIGQLDAACSVSMIPAPLRVSSAEVAGILKRETSVRDVILAATAADVAVVGIGSVNQRRDATILRSGYISEGEQLMYARKGAVGDILGYFLNAEGECVEELEIHKELLGVTLDELAQLPTIVGVAGGEEKADAIYAALKGRRINGLVTEETTARAVLALAG